MTTSTWEPTPSTPNSDISADDKLQHRKNIDTLIQATNTLNPDAILLLSKHLSDEILQALKALSGSLNFPKKAWPELLSEINLDELKQLVFLFSIVDSAYQELSLGDASPAIKIYTAIKKRKDKLSSEQLLWIKENCSNKFIPNGSIF